MAAKKKPAETPEAAQADGAAAEKPKAEKAMGGGELYEALLAAAGRARLAGEMKAHKDGLYTRLVHDGRTVAYVVRGKTVATVYPNAMAADAPPDLAFRTVELGSHHYGRGEIVVDVKSPDDVANAVAALKASTKMPAPPKRSKAAAEA